MSTSAMAVIGVGPGNGAALARRWVREGHPVGLLSRNMDALTALAEDLGEQAAPFACDASDPNSVQLALGQVAERFGPVDCLLYNAGSGSFGSIDEVSSEDLDMAWRINVLGLFTAVKTVLPSMRSKGSGAIVVTGATASLRGGANFMAFAQAKAAQRSLAQSLARKVGPDGIHVALVIVDGMIDLERTRSRMPNHPEEGFLKPDDIAEAVWFLAHQPRSAWTFELDLRPHVERW